MSKANVDYIRRRRRFSFVLLLVLIALVYSAFVQAADHSREELPPPPVDSTPALQVLEELEVNDPLPRQDYSREHFGSDWEQIEGCDMRNRILQRDLSETKVDEDNCTVRSGVLLDDPFTGERIDFERGRDSSQAIHIDHLVAVSDAWKKGAQQLSDAQREQFYNDPLNLLAVDNEANMAKGSKDASQWLPTADYRCRYIARQVAVKAKYLLWITKSEYEAMRRVLNTCPEQVLPIVETP